MPIANLRGLDVYYERQGTGPRLLFVNGSGATLETAAVLLAPFAEHFDLLAHDQRGLGRTTIPDDQPTMADYAADTLALADHVGWETFRLVGVSFGGMVAQEIAVTAPTRIERLALLCTSPGGRASTGESLSSYPLHELQDHTPAQRIEIGRRILDVRFEDASWLEANPADRFIADIFEQRTSAPRSDEQLRGERLQLEARRHHDVLDRLPSITCPTFVACGRYDGIAPALNSEAIVERVPNAQLRTYDGGHAFFFQDKRAIPDAIAFLGDR